MSRTSARAAPFLGRIREAVISRMHAAHETRRKARYRLIQKAELISDIKNAVANNAGYAAGKLGNCQQRWMYYEILLQTEKNALKIKKFEAELTFHGLKQNGIFPALPQFYYEYNKFYMPHVRNLDCIGICYDPLEWEILQYYKLRNKLIFYPDQEPDRSTPDNAHNCYLPCFRDKKILILCPFSGLLKERATREIFEGVWSKTGKKWFYPGNVDFIEFPYGFSAETHKKFSTAIDLFNHITGQIDVRDFDVALIAAAGLGIPLASYIKNKGKIAIELGGHLQFLFGVLGKRWREGRLWEETRTKYYNEWWIDMPEKYRPKETDVCDKGAYW